MEEDQISQFIQEALAGSRKLKITFKRESVKEAMHLFGMWNSGVIVVNDADVPILSAIMSTGELGHNKNRTFAVTIGEKFDFDWFASRIGKALENIEVVKK